MRYSLILRNRRKWRHNFLTLGDNSLEICRQPSRSLLYDLNKQLSQFLLALTALIKNDEVDRFAHGS
jgi:hypothetical protein